MPALEEKDVKDWGLAKCREEYGKALDEAQSIKDKNDGSLAGASVEDADTVKNLLGSANVLGERIDELKFLDTADAEFEGLSAKRKAPEGVVPVPGAEQRGEGRKGLKGPQDIGGMFVESDGFKAFKEDGALNRTEKLALSGLMAGYKGIGEVPSRVKALFDSGDYPIQDDFRPDPVLALFQPNTIGPLMAQGSTNASTIKYPKETVVSSGAGMVAEGTTKPEAEMVFTPVSDPVKKIAVWLPLTDEAEDDIPFLRSYINARLPLFVRNKEDEQLLKGDGTGNNIVGLLNRSGINVSTSVSLGGATPDQALIDGVFSSAMRVREAFLDPEAFVCRAATWETMRLAKDTTRNYLLGPPADEAPTRLWGLNGILNQNMPAMTAGNKAVLTGAFEAAAMVVRRSDIELAVSDSHSTFFVDNKLAIRAEERLALAVFRPAGFATVGITA